MSPPTSNQYLPELPGELDEAQKASVREAVSSKTPGLDAFGHMSDEWVAARVRMLMRSDLWHEAICSAGRDRIIRLSLKVAELEAEIKERKFFDSIPTASPERSAEMIAEARRQGRLPPDETGCEPAFRLLPIEREELVRWHRMCSQVSQQTDDFAGARRHRERLVELTSTLPLCDCDNDTGCKEYKDTVYRCQNEEAERRAVKTPDVGFDPRTGIAKEPQ